MKIINSIAVSMLITASALIFNGCSKDEDDPIVPVTPSTEQKLSFHLHTLAGTSSIAYGTEYQDASGRKFNLTDFRYYISNIVLIKNDNSELPLTGKVLLASPDENEYELGNVPVGSYKGFKFMLGLDSTTNHSDPTIYTSENPLAIQTPSIHWSWNSGYIFMKAEGKVDTTLANTGTTDYDFFYHVGMDGFERNIDFTNSPFTVASGSDYEIGIKFDFLDVLDNVDMRTENSTHTMDNMPLAMKIADNWQSSFTLE